MYEIVKDRMEVTLGSRISSSDLISLISEN